MPRVPQSSSPRPLSARQEPIARRVTSIGLPTACSPLPVIGRAGVLATEARRCARENVYSIGRGKYLQNKDLGRGNNLAEYVGVRRNRQGSYGD